MQSLALALVKAANGSKSASPGIPLITTHSIVTPCYAGSKFGGGLPVPILYARHLSYLSQMQGPLLGDYGRCYRTYVLRLAQGTTEAS